MGIAVNGVDESDPADSYGYYADTRPTAVPAALSGE